MTMEEPLIVHSRVTPWGFLVSLALAVAFFFTGAMTADANLLPEKLAIFVAPPEWLVAAVMLAFSVFLAMVGIAELVRYLRPSVEVVVDRTGVATFGLLGERRCGWDDITASRIDQETLSFRLRGKGRFPPPDLRIHFNRLDLSPHVLLARVRSHRPDLAPRLA